MTVAHDASTESATFTTTTPHTFSHTPSGTPRAVIVAIAHGSSTDLINSTVSYGGDAMTRIGTAADTATEAGRSYLYFLGTSIPTGTQTVSISHTGSADVKWAVCHTMTAAGDTTITHVENASENRTSNPAVITSYLEALRVGVLYSGNATPSDITLGSGLSAVQDHDFTAFIARYDRETTASTGEFAWTRSSATADDWAEVIAAIAEVPSSSTTLAVDAITHNAYFTTAPDPYTFTHTPINTPRGVLVFPYSMLGIATSNDFVTGNVTYGGVTMTEVVTAVDTTTEPGRVYAYFLGSSVPTGAQTVSIDHDAGAEQKGAIVVTLTGPSDLAVGASAIDENNQANPQAALDSGAENALRFAFIASGLATTSSLTQVGTTDRLVIHETANNSICLDVQPSLTSGSTTVGWTSGADDVAAVYIAIEATAAPITDEYAFASETDTAMPFDASSNLIDDYGFASETDSAMPFLADSNVLDEYAFAAETDEAMPFGATITVEDTYGFAEETDAAMPFSADSNLLDEYAFAEETDAAMPFTADSDLIDDYGFATETDEAMPFLAEAEEADVLDEYAFAEETDSAMPFLAASDTTDDYAFAEETDAAMPFTAVALSTDIEFDASSEGTATTGALSFTHTPVGDPAGIEVDVVVDASVADEITGVTYGGQALALKADARESVGESGRVQVWFLGTGIPTGAQTVVVSHTGSANAKWATCKSWTAAEDLVIVGTGNISDYGAGTSDATIPMWSLANAVRSGALFTGLLDPTNPVPIAGMTADEDHDFGSTVAQSIYETAQSSGSTEFGWGDIADEVAVAAITITVDSAVPVGTLEVEAISFHAGQPQGVADIVGIHPSPGTAAGVLVLTSNLVSSTWITDIDYGGEAMTAVVSAADTANELWRVDEYNLLTAVPTGDQIFTINTASSPATTDEQFRTVVVVTFATPVEKVVGATDAENQDDPQATLDSGAVDVIRFGILGSGLADPANATSVNLPERIQSLENGAASVVTDFDPTAASGSVTVGWNTTVSDDVAAIYTFYGEPQDILDEYAFADETDTAMPFLAATDQTVEFAFASETDEAMPFEAEAAEAIVQEYTFTEETDTAMPFIAEAEEPSPGDSPSPPDEGSPESPPESPVDSPIIDSPDDDSPDEPPFESPDADPADLCFPVFMARRCN